MGKRFIYKKEIYMEKETFNQIMSGYFSERGSLIKFVKIVYPFDNFKTKYRGLKKYLDGDRIPSFQDAKALLNDMGVNISDDELIEILNYSNQEKENKYKKEAIVSGITINYDDILKDTKYKTDDKVIILQGCLKNRNCKSNKEYIIKLIEKDIEETIL